MSYLIERIFDLKNQFRHLYIYLFSSVSGLFHSFYFAVNLLVPTHASLRPWHSVHGSVLDPLHQLRSRQGPPGRPEHVPHWPRLSRHPPALHGPPRPARGSTGSPAGSGSWEACERLLPAGLRCSAGQKHQRLPAVFDPGHKRELLCDSSWFEWSAGGGMAELNGYSTG